MEEIPANRMFSGYRSAVLDRNLSDSFPSEARLVMFERVHPLIQSFFERMTGDQWERLRSGSPDSTTTSLLAELLVNVVISVSNSLLSAMQNFQVKISADDIQESLGDTLPESFAQALGVQDRMSFRTEEAEQLKELVVREVSDTVNSVLAVTRSEEPVVNQHITSPRRLKAMLRYTLTMLRRFLRPMYVAGGRQRRKQVSISQDVVEELVKELVQEELEEEEQQLLGEDEAPVLDQRLMSSDSFVEATTENALDIIRKEVDTITEPLLEDVEDAEYKLLQAQITQEMQSVADDVAQLISEEDKNLEEAKAKQKSKVSLRAVGSRVQAFLAKCRAKAWILCMLVQRKKKAKDESREQRRESLQSILDIVDSLFATEGGESPMAGNQLNVFPRLSRVLRGSDQPLTRQLDEMIFNYISGKTTMPEIIPESLRAQAASPEDAGASEANMSRIQNTVSVFLSVMNWWLQTQANQHTDRVTLALTGSDSSEPVQPAGTPMEGLTRLASERRAAPSAAEDAAAASAAERRRMTVKILVESIIYLTFTKARVRWAVKDRKALMEQLFNKIWAEVDDIEFQITAQLFEDFDKVVFKKLCKTFGDAKLVLVSMCSQEQAMEDYLIASFRDRLMKKPSSLCLDPWSM